MDKQDILDNVASYTARQLADYILDGTVTYDELCTQTDGRFNRSKRREVKRLLDVRQTPPTPPPTPAPAPVSVTPKMDVASLTSMIERAHNDTSIANPEAYVLQELQQLLDSGELAPVTLVRAMVDDPNMLHSSTVLSLLQDGSLQRQQLTAAGFDPRMVAALGDNALRRQQFQQPRRLEKLEKASTEVYFWGIPSSGKTCALGALMSVAADGSVARTMHDDPGCQGYGYMTRLKSLFRSDGRVSVLPAGTSIYSTYAMRFDLEDTKGKTHPITCVDLAGELVRCMYKSDAGASLSHGEAEALETLTNILIDNRTGSRKIHIFVIEYGGDQRVYEGLTQQTYLNAALAYINRTDIFRKDTDAIYLMLTKADKTGLTGSDMHDELSRYVDTNYRGFYNGLESICRRHHINGGRVERIPFSLGQVCFQDYCLFNPASAANMVRLLLATTKGFRQGRLFNICNSLK